jgi:acetolactate synthase-1/2/3 large subunit
MPFLEAVAMAGGLRMIMARHETGAVFMADGFQRVAGGLAVCVTTAGPGATNAVTGAACARADGVPMLIVSALPGSVATSRNPVQDSSTFGIDTVELYRAVTKKSVLLSDPECAADIVRSLTRIAFEGRPGPVHLAVPADLFGRAASGKVLAPAQYRAETAGCDTAAIERAADLLLSCRQAVILAGNGVRIARAQQVLAELALALGVPVATTPKGKGLLPEDSERPKSLGVFGFGGSELAEKLIFDAQTDVLLAVGTSFGELQTNAWDARLGAKKIIQIDVDPTRIANAYPVTIAIAGDARSALSALKAAIGRKPRRAPLRTSGTALPAPLKRTRAHSLVKAQLPAGGASGRLGTPHVMAELDKYLTEQSHLFVDVGSCMTYALHSLIVRNSNGFHINLGFASMGHAVAAVIGAQLAKPNAPAICVCGDGALLMAAGEIHAAVEADAACTWVVLNNSGQSSVRAGVRHRWGEGASGAELVGMTRHKHTVNFALLAQAMGAEGFLVETAADMAPVLARAVACKRPALLDVRIDPDEEPNLSARLATLDKFFDQKE